MASSPSFREKLELWVFRGSLVPAWEQLEQREMAPGIGGEARPREAAAWGMMGRGQVNATPFLTELSPCRAREMPSEELFGTDGVLRGGVRSWAA